MLKLDKKLILTPDVIRSPNLTDRFERDDLQRLGQHIYRGYETDEYSRSVWLRRMNAAMDLALQVAQAKTFPWPGAANVIFPLVTIAALQFSARSYGNLIQGTDVVKYRVTEEDPTGELKARGERISRHMSWQVLEEDESWEEQHDRLFINLAIVGTAFVKSYFSPTKGYTTSELVSARDLVINYWAKSVETCGRKTQIIPLFRNEIYERAKGGIFRDVLEESWYTSMPAADPRQAYRDDQRSGLHPPGAADEETPFLTLEQHVSLDLDQDGYAEPYIATIEKSSREVLRLVSRVDRVDDVERNRSNEIVRIKATEYFTKYSFIPSPDGGIYDIGFGILLGPLNEAVNSGINQMLDAGTMSNTSGGFLGRGAKIRGGSVSMAPWEWVRVDATGDDLRKSMIPLPTREPSAVMFNLISLLISYVERASGATDLMVGKTPGQNTPAETSRNALEQGMQIYTTIFKRVWRSMKEEFKKRHALNAVFLKPRQTFGKDRSVVMQEDYQADPSQVVPVADPNIASTAMRLTQAQALREASRTAPGYDLAAVERYYLKALRIDEIDTLYPGPDKVPSPEDPKIQIEKMRQEGAAMKLEHERLMLAATLMEQRALNEAKVRELEAKAASLIATIGAEQAAHQLEAFRTVTDALNEHNSLMNERIQMLMTGGKEDERGGTSDAGDVGGLEELAGDASLLGGAPQMAGGGEGAMGAGELLGE
ncbi:MAG: hypothetical protein SFV24_19135 [Gemmatimonadales bacterium]|nr:hypothetical protein [Gemmatimonadales bacterium]